MDLDEGSEVDDEDVWWYICTLCNRAYTADNQLRAHKRRWHGAEKAKGAGVRILSQGVDLAPVVKLTRCPSSSSTKSHFSQDCDDPERLEPTQCCLEQFSAPQANTFPNSTAQNLLPEVASSPVQDIEEAVKLAGRGSSKPTCPECGKRFRDNYTLKRHRRLVPNGKGRKPNWNSNGCRSKSLGGASSGTYHSHKDSFLLPSRLVKGAWDCRLCGKVVNEAALHQHVQRVHPDVEQEERKQFEPDVADLAAIGPSDLHHKCQHCLEQFPTLDNLKTHVLLVHAPAAPDRRPASAAAGSIAPNLKTESPSPVRGAVAVSEPEPESPHERHTPPEEAAVCNEINLVDEKPRLRSRPSREVAVPDPEGAAADDQSEPSEESPRPPKRSSRHSRPPARLHEEENFARMFPQCPLCHKVLRDKYSLQRHQTTVHASDRGNTFRSKDVITIVAAFLRQCEQQRQQEAADPLSLAIESSRIRCPICLDFYPNLAAKFEQHVRNKHAKHLYRAEHRLPCHCMTCYKVAFLRPSAPKAPTTSDAATSTSAWECKSCGASVHQVAIRAHARRKHADHIMLPPPPQVGDSEWRATASRLGEANEPPTLVASAASVDEADEEILEGDDQAEVEDEIEDDTIEPDDNPSMSPKPSEGGTDDLDRGKRHRIEKYAVIITDPERASSVQKPRGVEAQRATQSTKLRCRICSKVYPGCSDKFRRHFITEHISKIPTSGPPTCQICPKKFRTPGSLKLHMRLVHEPDFGHPDPLQMQTKEPEMPVESGHQVEEELENETYAHSEGADSRPSDQAAGEEASSSGIMEPEYKEEEGAEADFQASAAEYKVEAFPDPEPTLPHDEGEPPRLRPRISHRSRLVQLSYAEFNSEDEDDAGAPNASYSPPPSSPSSSSSEEEEEEEEKAVDDYATSETESECEDKPNSSRSSTRGRFSCRKCPRSYADQYGLRKHIKAAHEDVPRGGSRTYQWRDNAGGTEVRSLIDTFTANCKQRVGRLHQCSLCYNWYEGPRKLRQHTHKHIEHLIRIRDGSDSCDCVSCYQNAYLRPNEGAEVPWECRLCKWVVGEAGIRLHMRSFHKGHETPSLMRQDEEEKEMSEWRKVKTNSGVPQEGEGATSKEEAGGGMEGEEIRVKCPICHKLLYDKYNLKRHLETVHGTKKPKKGASSRVSRETTQVDPKVVAAFLQQRQQHERQEEQVKCSICLAFFPDLEKFQLHVRHMHGKHLQRAKERLPCHCMTCYKDGFLRPTSVATTECAWECKLCGESVKEIAIRMHVQRNHVDQEMLAPGGAAGGGESESEWRSAVVKLHEGGVGVEVEDPAREEGPEFQCRICQKVYSSSSTLRRHFRSNHNSMNRPTCQICQKAFKTRAYLRYHMKIRHGPDAASRNHLCSTCGQSFKTGTELRLHSRRHDPSSSDTFNCDICGKPCFHSGALRRHKLSHQAHSVPCPHCGKTFKSGNCIQIHLARTHGEALYKCTKCDKSYTTRKHLAEHEAIHREDTPFQCPKCPKAFKSKKLLGHHRNKVHTERFHLCHVCGHEFRKKGRALQHELDAHNFQRVEVAKIFECEYKGCDRKFATVFMLNQHQTVHNERSLQCETCGKGFKAKHHLDQHKMTHVPYEELPYVCDICGKRSGWPAHAREHKQRIHGVGAKKVTQSKRKPGSESETEKELDSGRGNND